MDALLLSVLYAVSGLLVLGYYGAVPAKNTLVRKLPNRVSIAGLVLLLIVLGAGWYFVSLGHNPIFGIFVMLFMLLVFETFFLLLLRWLSSTMLAVLVALATAGGLYAVYEFWPSFALVNGIIILASMGAVTLLIKMSYLRTKLLWVIAGLWTIYDVLTVTYLLPEVFVPAAEPRLSLFLPALTVGSLTLGSGDVIFLALFTLILRREYGRETAIFFILASALGLYLAALAYLSWETAIPFLVVLTPLFFLFTLIGQWRKR